MKFYLNQLETSNGADVWFILFGWVFVVQLILIKLTTAAGLDESCCEMKGNKMQQAEMEDELLYLLSQIEGKDLFLSNERPPNFMPDFQTSIILC